MSAARADEQDLSVGRLRELLASVGGYIAEQRSVRVLRSVQDLRDEELAALASSGDV